VCRLAMVALGRDASLLFKEDFMVTGPPGPGGGDDGSAQARHPHEDPAYASAAGKARLVGGLLRAVSSPSPDKPTRPTPLTSPGQMIALAVPAPLRCGIRPSASAITVGIMYPNQIRHPTAVVTPTCRRVDLIVQPGIVMSTAVDATVAGALADLACWKIRR
jgi:hypothetical protein